MKGDRWLSVWACMLGKPSLGFPAPCEQLGVAMHARNPGLWITERHVSTRGQEGIWRASADVFLWTPQEGTYPPPNSNHIHTHRHLPEEERVKAYSEHLPCLPWLLPRWEGLQIQKEALSSSASQWNTSTQEPGSHGSQGLTARWVPPIHENALQLRSTVCPVFR